MLHSSDTSHLQSRWSYWPLGPPGSRPYPACMYRARQTPRAVHPGPTCAFAISNDRVDPDVAEARHYVICTEPKSSFQPARWNSYVTQPQAQKASQVVAVVTEAWIDGNSAQQVVVNVLYQRVESNLDNRGDLMGKDAEDTATRIRSLATMGWTDMTEIGDSLLRIGHGQK